MNILKRLIASAVQGNSSAAYWLAPAALLLLNAAAYRQLARLEDRLRSLEDTRRQAAAYAADLRSERDQKAKTSAIAKSSATSRVQSGRTLYEAGLGQQEEKRLLEKVLDIISTYLEVDQQSGRINLSRGDQVIKSFTISPLTLLSIGVKQLTPPGLCRITAKERYAAPERGKAEKTENGLKWDPPQDGGTLRDKALGEYVIFTDSPLVFHAPVKDAAAHAAYPHLCAGLTLYSAKALYDKVFIGNKILIKPPLALTPPSQKITDNKQKPAPARGPAKSSRTKRPGSGPRK